MLNMIEVQKLTTTNIIITCNEAGKVKDQTHH